MISESIYDDYFGGNNASKNREMTERKLQLIEQVRNENQKNEYKLSRHRQAIYGKSSKNVLAYDNDYSSTYNPEGIGFEKNDKLFSIKMRFVCAVFLLTFMVLMDITGKTVGNISTKTIKESISMDYETLIVSRLQLLFDK